MFLILKKAFFFFPVVDQQRAVAEGFATHRAMVRLLATVAAAVLEQCGAPTEGLTACGTLVGPRASVDAPVLRQRGAVAE